MLVVLNINQDGYTFASADEVITDAESIWYHYFDENR